MPWNAPGEHPPGGVRRRTTADPAGRSHLASCDDRPGDGVSGRAAKRWLPSRGLTDLADPSDTIGDTVETVTHSSTDPSTGPPTVPPATPFVLGGPLRWSWKGALSIA